MNKRCELRSHLGHFSGIGVAVLAGSLMALAQGSSLASEDRGLVAPPELANSATLQGQAIAAAVAELQKQVRELREVVAEMRSQTEQYQQETASLRRELQRTRIPPPSTNSSHEPGPVQDQGEDNDQAKSQSIDQRMTELADTAELLKDKVDEQYRTKVEAASKYRIRLSGIVLMNIFNNRGAVDNQDFPTYAFRQPGIGTNSSFGATLRQSELGLEVFGPHLAGARTSGEVQFDLSGGFPQTANGVNSGLFRLRIADIRMDWDRTSVVAGQDALFLSPLSPTTFASLAVPGFAYAGNLWGWIPQLRVEHRFALSESETLAIQGGIFDNLTGDLPYAESGRQPQAGEKSGQPAYGSRAAWTRSIDGRNLTVGLGGYYGRQNWILNRHVDGWAGMTDIQIPLTSRLELSGEFYRGKAVGGIGGGIGQSVLFDGDPNIPASQLSALRSMGGWSQLKFRATPKLEFNGALGIDDPFAADIKGYPWSVNYNSPLAENRDVMLNFIYRPRSDLLLSGEYRHLRTSIPNNANATAEQVNLMMGVLF